jgi:hypothetical protein
MPDSEHLKDLKSTWGQSCHSMWAELLSISMGEMLLVTRYMDIPDNALLERMVYSPEVQGRLHGLTKDRFLAKAREYKDSVVTNRVIFLSASFELYLNNFIESYIAQKPKLFDLATSRRTADGDKIYGEAMKIRGLSNRIREFAALVPFKIHSLAPQFGYLDDVYTLRNVLAHRAGQVDARTSSQLTHVTFQTGQRVSLSPLQLLNLADPVIKIAETLDGKLR